MSQKTYITSNTLFGEGPLIGREYIPFENKQIMTKSMVQFWNSIVGENDIVFHLGNVYTGNSKDMNLLKELHGRKILILGEEDNIRNSKWKRLGFQPHNHYIYEDYLLTHAPVDLQPLSVAMNYDLLKGNIIGQSHSKTANLDLSFYRSACAELYAYRPIEFKNFIEIWHELKCLQKST